MALSNKEIQEIKERIANLTTPSEWKWSGDKWGDISIYSPEERGFHNNGGEVAGLEANQVGDAEFIVNAKNDILKLLQEVEELKSNLKNG